MRRSLVIAVMVLAVAAFRPGAVAAEEPSPGGGDAFGQHVASMAPEHPRSHGPAFGECVSTLATTGTCPHHP
jgi:hypothetical protein